MKGLIKLRKRLLVSIHFPEILSTYLLLSLPRKNICNLIGHICTLFSIFVLFDQIRKKKYNIRIPQRKTRNVFIKNKLIESNHRGERTLIDLN